MINKRSIEDFLSRRLADYDFVKAYSNADLDLEFAGLNPPPNLGHVKLWKHQRACLLLLLELKRFLLFMDMGGGKTITTLMLLKYRKQRGEKPKAIVFVPYITSVETWIEEVRKHAPDLSCTALLGTGSEIIELLNHEADLVVGCYSSVVAAISEPAEKNGRGIWVLRDDFVTAFASYDTIVCDEIHRSKNIHSLTYQMCRGISARTEYTIGLTGTPLGRDLQDLWPQFNLIDFGATLGPTLGLYRGAFFTTKRNYFGGYEYEFQKKKLPLLKQAIKNASISYTVDEFTDMPSKEYIVRQIAPPPDGSGYCTRCLEDLKKGAVSKDYQLIQSNYLQLRQLSSGFMTLRGEDNDKLQIAFDSNPKLEALTEILEGVPDGSKVVVFHHFVYTSSLLHSHLNSLKIKHARIWGGQRDPIGELRKFKDDPSCTVLVLNWKSGSSSLNLQGANYMVVFEQPDSPIDRKQGEARLWRPGQTRRVFVYDLLVRETVDDKLHKANEAGRDLLKQLLKGDWI